MQQSFSVRNLDARRVHRATIIVRKTYPFFDTVILCHVGYRSIGISHHGILGLGLNLNLNKVRIRGYRES